MSGALSGVPPQIERRGGISLPGDSDWLQLSEWLSQRSRSQSLYVLYMACVHLMSTTPSRPQYNLHVAVLATFPLLIAVHARSRNSYDIYPPVPDYEFLRRRLFHGQSAPATCLERAQWETELA